MRSWSIPVGRILCVELRVHLTFVFLLAFILLTESAVRGSMNVERGLALAGIIFGSVVLHELGHALVGLHAGIPAKAIVLLPIGGVTLLDETRQRLDVQLGSWKRDIRIALAGPLVNLGAAFVAVSILLAVAPEVALWNKPWVFSSNLPRSLVWVNI